MRRNISVIIPIFIMIAVSGICIGIYMIFTNTLPKKNNDTAIINNNNSNNIVADNNSVVLTKNELPRIDCVGLTQPLLTEILRNFTQDKEISENDIKASVTDEGFNKLLNDQTDVLLSTYPSEEILELARTRGIELDIIPIATDGFVFFVNVNNPISGLKVSEVQKIYNGQVNNWSQLGGNNQKIKAFQRPKNSPTQKEMIVSVMKNLQIIDPPKDVFYDKNFGEIDDLIASYDNSEDAIGYSYLYETNVLYDVDAKVDNTIKILKINDVEPNYETIKNGTYPIKTNYYLIKNKANKSESLQIFVDNVLSERGKSVIKGAGYVEN